MAEKNVRELDGLTLLDDYAQSILNHNQAGTRRELRDELVRRLTEGKENEKKIKQLEDILKTTKKGFAEYAAGVQSCPDK